MMESLKLRSDIVSMADIGPIDGSSVGQDTDFTRSLPPGTFRSKSF